MRYLKSRLLAVLVGSLVGASTLAGPASSAVRETAEFVIGKFGRGAAGQTVQEVSDATGKAVARHGDDALPFLRRSGHRGFEALDEAGAKGPDVIRLFARRGDEAIWIISEPRKLAIFLKHGDSAADALLKHPGIADDLIVKYGDNAVGALDSVSRQGAQRLGIVADEGLLVATPRSAELLAVIRRYGDGAMDFIWKNKGALTVATVLGSFLADPQAYISGAKQLIVDPVIGPVVQRTNWTLILLAILGAIFLVAIVRRVANARAAITGDGRSW